MSELLKSHKLEELPAKHSYNISVLLDRINLVREAYGQPMTVTSGYRSLAEHLAIYAAKGITNQAHIPMQSRHLTGEAVDIADASSVLKEWILANRHRTDGAGFWFESFDSTPNWVHFQTIPPKSGNRFFVP